MNEKMARTIVRERSENLCERCGLYGTTVHHRKNRSQGGKWNPANCVALCGDGTRGCHGWVTMHPLQAREGGWHIHPMADEYDSYLELWQAGGRRVLLNVDGSFEIDDLDEAPGA